LEPLGFGRRLHLDQAHSRPDQIEEAPRLRLLEVRDVGAVRSVALEELVKERLRLAPFASGIDAPTRGECGEPRADLLAEERHGYRVSCSFGTAKYVACMRRRWSVSSSRSASDSASTR